MPSQSQPGAIVLGGHVGALGAARSLGRCGIPVRIADTSGASIARFSRYCRAFHRIPPTACGAEFVPWLLELAAREHLEGWVLFHTNDALLEPIARAADSLSSRLHLTTPLWETTRIAYDKRVTYHFAKELGIPCPLTAAPAGPDELRAIAEQVTYPVLIKPAVMHAFYARTKRKVYLARDAHELIAIYNDLTDLPDQGAIMVQEIIPGPPENIYSYCSACHNGTPLVAYVNRHLRQIPMDFGKVATLVESAEHPTVAALAVRLLAALAFTGPSEIEFKVDARTGEPKLLDMNPRLWKQHALGLSLGINLPLVAFQTALGSPPPPRDAQAPAGIRWIEGPTDAYVAAGEMLRGRLTPLRYIQTLRRIRVASAFAIDDPLPAIAEAALLPFLMLAR